MDGGSVSRKHPLAEVFGYPADDMSAEASRSRQNKFSKKLAKEVLEDE